MEKTANVRINVLAENIPHSPMKVITDFIETLKIDNIIPEDHKPTTILGTDLEISFENVPYESDALDIIRRMEPHCPFKYKSITIERKKGPLQ